MFVVVTWIWRYGYVESEVPPTGGGTSLLAEVVAVRFLWMPKAGVLPHGAVMRRDKPCGVSKASRSARSSARWWLQESCLLSLMDGKGKDVLFRKAWQDWKKRRVSRIIQMPGGVAERPIAPVLKTGVTQVTEGSNPSPSALSYKNLGQVACKPIATRQGRCWVNCWVSPAPTIKSVHLLPLATRHRHWRSSPSSLAWTNGA